MHTHYRRENPVIESDDLNSSAESESLSHDSRVLVSMSVRVQIGHAPTMRPQYFAQVYAPKDFQNNYVQKKEGIQGHNETRLQVMQFTPIDQSSASEGVESIQSKVQVCLLLHLC